MSNRLRNTQIGFKSSELSNKKIKLSFKKPERRKRKCSYGKFFPFLDKTQWKWMLFSSVLSGLELMFESTKYPPFLRSFQPCIYLFYKTTQHRPSWLCFRNKAMANPFYTERCPACKIRARCRKACAAANSYKLRQLTK